jgi:membrane associated rhomboid family serine protease
LTNLRKPNIRAAFDKEEKKYFLKVALLIILIYYFQDDIYDYAGIVALFLPTAIFSYLYFKSMHTGERLRDLVREQITLVPVPYAEGGKKIFIPWATIILVLINAAVFYITRQLSAAELESFENNYMFLPLDPTPWTLLVSPLTCMFMHGNAGHLWGNMTFLWAFAPAVEERLGTKKFVYIYLLTGLAGEAISLGITRIFFNEILHSLGASAAVSGIMGIFMVRCYFKKLVIPIPVLGFISFKLKVNSLLPMGFFFLRDLSGGIRLLAGSQSQIDYWAHVGSMVAGILMAMLFKMHRAAVEEKYTEAGLAAIDNQYFGRKSKESLQKALELNPENQKALLGLAREYAVTRKPEGRELFEKAIRLALRSSPQRAVEIYREYFPLYNLMLAPDLQYALVRTFYNQGDLETTLRSLEMVIAEPSTSDPTRQQAFQQLITILAENNMLEAAHYRLRQFAEQFPGSDLVKTAEAKFVEVLKK